MDRTKSKNEELNLKESKNLTGRYRKQSDVSVLVVVSGVTNVFAERDKRLLRQRREQFSWYWYVKILPYADIKMAKVSAL